MSSTAHQPAKHIPSKSFAAPASPSVAVMPTYARQNVVFERGEGAWLISTSGERYLDFASGVAVNALGHAHPKLIAALTEQAAEAVALFQPLSRRRPGAACRAAVRGDVRRQGVLLQLRRGSLRGRHQAGAPLSLRQRRIPSAGASSPSRAPFTAAHWRPSRRPATRSTWRASVSRAEGFDLVAFGDLEAVEKAIGPRDGRHHGRAGAGRRRRARRGPAVLAGAARAVPTSTACC